MEAKSPYKALAVSTNPSAAAKFASISAARFWKSFGCVASANPCKSFANLPNGVFGSYLYFAARLVFSHSNILPPVLMAIVDHMRLFRSFSLSALNWSTCSCKNFRASPFTPSSILSANFCTFSFSQFLNPYPASSHFPVSLLYTRLEPVATAN